MREILFRAKNNSKEWIYGFPAMVDKFGSSYFFTFEDDKFIPNIVSNEYIGQFTGLTDKNGTKIFEGDILKNEKGICFGGEYKACVEYSDVFGKYCAVSDCVEFEANDFDYLEVIGNTFDNPELLKGGEGE